MARLPTAAVTATYILHLPPGVDHPSPLTPSANHTFPLSPPNSPQPHDPTPNTAETGELHAYYKKLRSAISDARMKLGDELTAWRDAVGSGEVGKEKAVKTVNEEESEEEANGTEERV
ncbi:hypothetical protein SCLCIDRAFT_1207233 [Scleroderma citrinum Foug A]|uniref:EKC/KEOPS complex subunit GON7 n=1 Tax=Scleroderma citrinum Foug A TaxID=1036808 RepID=A0A0C3EP62_9AGAM|nr:hypothetical protein SCLCIDRAFT_1207233 [Scleroderma citrinum Foug A]